MLRINLLLLLAARWLYRSMFQQLGGEPRDARQLTHQLAEGNLSRSIQPQAGTEHSLIGELARLQQLSTLSSRLDQLFSEKATGISAPWSSFFDSVNALSSNAAGSAGRSSKSTESSPRVRATAACPVRSSNSPTSR